jgi:hypothetical protein
MGRYILVLMLNKKALIVKFEGNGRVTLPYRYFIKMILNVY